MSLATLDLSQFVSGTHGQRAEFAEALLTGFTKHGFVKLTNHGFSTGDIVKLFSQVVTRHLWSSDNNEML
jgi:isopenicillin N synthase-like dioxygenase